MHALLWLLIKQWDLYSSDVRLGVNLNGHGDDIDIHMSSEICEKNGCGHNLKPLTILHYFCVSYPTKSGCRANCNCLRPLNLFILREKMEKNLTCASKNITKPSAASSLRKPWKLLSSELHFLYECSAYCHCTKVFQNILSLETTPIYIYLRTSKLMFKFGCLRFNECTHTRLGKPANHFELKIVANFIPNWTFTSYTPFQGEVVKNLTCAWNLHLHNLVRFPHFINPKKLWSLTNCFNSFPTWMLSVLPLHQDS